MVNRTGSSSGNPDIAPNLLSYYSSRVSAEATQTKRAPSSLPIEVYAGVGKLLSDRDYLALASTCKGLRAEFSRPGLLRQRVTGATTVFGRLAQTRSSDSLWTAFLQQSRGVLRWPLCKNEPKIGDNYYAPTNPGSVETRFCVLENQGLTKDTPCFSVFDRLGPQGDQHLHHLQFSQPSEMLIFSRFDERRDLLWTTSDDGVQLWHLTEDGKKDGDLQSNCIAKLQVTLPSLWDDNRSLRFPYCDKQVAFVAGFPQSQGEESQALVLYSIDALLQKTTTPLLEVENSFDWSVSSDARFLVVLKTQDAEIPDTYTPLPISAALKGLLEHEEAEQNGETGADDEEEPVTVELWQTCPVQRIWQRETRFYSYEEGYYDNRVTLSPDGKLLYLGASYRYGVILNIAAEPVFQQAVIIPKPRYFTYLCQFSSDTHHLSIDTGNDNYLYCLLKKDFTHFPAWMSSNRKFESPCVSVSATKDSSSFSPDGKLWRAGGKLYPLNLFECHRDSHSTSPTPSSPEIVSPLHSLSDMDNEEKWDEFLSFPEE